MRVYCKKCPGTKFFKNRSYFMKHQRSVHQEDYKNSGSHKRSVETKEVKLLGEPQITQLASEMTVTQLLAKLKDQKNFLSDVISLVEGLSK